MKPYLIGEGQLATAFSKHFINNGIDFDWFKSSQHQRYFNSKDTLTDRYYLCAVQDQNLNELMNNFQDDETSLYLIFSGNYDISTLHQTEFVIRLHPMMTFPMSSSVSIIEKSPFLYQGNPKYLNDLKQTLKITNVFDFNIKNPEAYHMMGVFASNFQFALMQIIMDLGKMNQIDVDTSKEFILPIMKQTIENLENNLPLFEMLTGPAKREDQDTINQHSNFLDSKNKDYKLIYDTLTQILLNLKK